MKTSSVYVVQCKTWAIAKRLTGVIGNVSKVDEQMNPPYLLRVVPECRSDRAKAFRKQVADEVRKLRKFGEV